MTHLRPHNNIYIAHVKHNLCLVAADEETRKMRGMKTSLFYKKRKNKGMASVLNNIDALLINCLLFI